MLTEAQRAALGLLIACGGTALARDLGGLLTTKALLRERCISTIGGIAPWLPVTVTEEGRRVHREDELAVRVTQAPPYKIAAAMTKPQRLALARADEDGVFCASTDIRSRLRALGLSRKWGNGKVDQLTQLGFKIQVAAREQLALKGIR